MSEQEKTIWKVEIIKQSEDVDDEIDQRLNQITEERARIKETVNSNRGFIS